MRSLFFALQADGVLVQIRAVVETYVGDYGLENCTLSARRMHGEDGASVAIDVSLLPLTRRPGPCCVLGYANVRSRDGEHDASVPLCGSDERLL